jgi:hypothetical protein
MSPEPGSKLTLQVLLRGTKEWQAAAQGTSIAELARSFRLLAAYAEALAESVDQQRGIIGVEAEDQRQAI